MAEDEQDLKEHSQHLTHHHEGGGETHELSDDHASEALKDELPTEDDVPAVVAAATDMPITGQNIKGGKKTWLHFFKTKWGITVLVVIGVLLIAGVLTAIPVTRYGILGNFIHKDAAVSVVDSKTGKPITAADVSLPGVSAQTDKNGNATLKNVPVGQYTLTIKKRYYKDANQTVTVPVLSAPSFGQIKFEATGRQVPVTVTNKITGQPLAKVTINALGSSAITDDQGKATIVVPANTTTVKATLKADNYNDGAVDVAVVEQVDPKNNFTLTPTGKVYFLSNRTGVMNVMGSDLDGNNQQVVVQATGKEDTSNTYLSHSDDWKYIALVAKRTDNPKPQLYILNTSNNKLSLIEEGNIDIAPLGWSKQYFVYEITRGDIPMYAPRHEALKSVNAATGTVATMDETDAANMNPDYYVTEDIAPFYVHIYGNEVTYFKVWSAKPASLLANHNLSFMSVQADGSNKKQLKVIDQGQGSFYFGGQRVITPNTIYFTTTRTIYTIPSTVTDNYYQYQYGGGITDVTREQYNDYSRPNLYIPSPAGQKTYWNEPRDGKTSLIVGDANGKNGKQIAGMTDFVAYGWYGEDYVLAVKNSGEMYILSATGTDASKAVKVVDFYWTRGYGY